MKQPCWTISLNETWMPGQNRVTGAGYASATIEERRACLSATPMSGTMPESHQQCLLQCNWRNHSRSVLLFGQSVERRMAELYDTMADLSPGIRIDLGFYSAKFEVQADNETGHARVRRVRNFTRTPAQDHIYKVCPSSKSSTTIKAWRGCVKRITSSACGSYPSVSSQQWPGLVVIGTSLWYHLLLDVSIVEKERFFALDYNQSVLPLEDLYTATGNFIAQLRIAFPSAVIVISTTPELP